MAISICGYQFEGPYTNMTYLKNRAGVYVILDKRSNGKWTVIDVGESTEVRDRVENHDRTSCWQNNRLGTLGVAAYYTTGWTPQQRRSLEAEIRAAYSPACGVR